MWVPTPSVVLHRTTSLLALLVCIAGSDAGRYSTLDPAPTVSLGNGVELPMVSSLKMQSCTDRVLTQLVHAQSISEANCKGTHPDVSTDSIARISIFILGSARYRSPLRQVALGTGSGQKGNVTDAVRLWLGETVGVGIDTAYDYEDEAYVAAGIAASGKTLANVFIETKIPCGTYSVAQAQIRDNLKQLGVASVNLTLLHNLECTGGASVADTWRALEDAKESGLTASIGVSAVHM